MTDYPEQGPITALAYVERKMGRAKARGVGCCLGGTLFSFIAAHMERPKDERPLSATFQAAPADFSVEGELMLFIFESADLCS
ncbi:MAG: hypothetical protein AAGF27_04805 [Pseudomonadota bacterium]